MAEGYVIDRTYGSVAVGSWVEGTPERSVWTGLKLTGKAKVDVATWRCGRCGFLEQYAAGRSNVFPARVICLRPGRLIMAKGSICPAVVRSEGDLLYFLMIDASA